MQPTTNALVLPLRAHVGVPDQRHVLHVLDAHHANQLAVLLVSPELDAIVDLVLQLLPGHVGLLPPVRGDHAPVCLGGVVDDLEDRVEVAIFTSTDHKFSPWCWWGG